MVLSVGTRRELPRRTVRAALETHIALPALSARRNKQSFGMHGQVAHEFAGIFLVNLRPAGHGDFDIIGTAAGTILAHAGRAVFGAEFPPGLEINQCVDVLIGNQVDTAAAATVAAIGTAPGNIFFTPETDTAGPAVAGPDVNDCFVDEFHGELERSIVQ